MFSFFSENYWEKYFQHVLQEVFLGGLQSLRGGGWHLRRRFFIDTVALSRYTSYIFLGDFSVSVFLQVLRGFQGGFLRLFLRSTSRRFLLKFSLLDQFWAQNNFCFYQFILMHCYKSYHFNKYNKLISLFNVAVIDSQQMDMI